MGKAIPSQHHPAVVLRSHSRAVRALLAVAMIAVVCLTAALVIAANDDNAGTSSAKPHRPDQLRRLQPGHRQARVGPAAAARAARLGRSRSTSTRPRATRAPAPTAGPRKALRGRAASSRPQLNANGPPPRGPFALQLHRTSSPSDQRAPLIELHVRKPLNLATLLLYSDTLCLVTNRRSPAPTLIPSGGAGQIGASGFGSVEPVKDAPDRIRTCGLRFRRPTLYPAELRALGVQG